MGVEEGIGGDGCGGTVCGIWGDREFFEGVIRSVGTANAGIMDREMERESTATKGSDD